MVMAQCTPKLSLSMVCLGSCAIAHQALQIQVKGQRAWCQGYQRALGELQAREEELRKQLGNWSDIENWRGREGSGKIEKSGYSCVFQVL